MTTNSILTAIYTALAGMSLSYVDRGGATVSPSVYYDNTLPNSMETANLPARVLLPPNGSMDVLRGAGVNTTWTINDLFLIDTAARDVGVRSFAPVMASYCANYGDAIGKTWQILSGNSTLTLSLNVSINSGKYEYPSGSGTYFYGCLAILTIEEIY